jgi:adenylate cyclase
MIACADEYGFPYWSSIGTIHLGWAQAMQGAGEAGLERMEAGLAAYRRTGASLALPWFLGTFAEAQRAAGHWEAAAQTLDDALAMVERTGELQASSIAQEQQAQGWSLRAATSLARLWMAQGRGAAAQQLLAPVYDQFTEGFDTADLRAAKTLLDELA